MRLLSQPDTRRDWKVVEWILSIHQMPSISSPFDRYERVTEN